MKRYNLTEDKEEQTEVRGKKRDKKKDQREITEKI